MRDPTKTNAVIAIDPGASGGIAIYDPYAYKDERGAYVPVTSARPMPHAITDILQMLDAFYDKDPIVVIEEVPKFVAGMQTSASAMATLHQNFGYILGALDAFKFRVKLIKPQAWQKQVDAGTKANYGTKWKAHLKDLATRRFPLLGKQVTLKTADALLILSTQI